MDIYQAIDSRRTIRDFEPRAIPGAILEKILAAGMAAPTNNHMREWHFVLLSEREQRLSLVSQLIQPISTKGAIGIVNRWGLVDEKQREVYIEAIPRQFNMLAECGCLVIPCYHQDHKLLKPRTLSDLNPFASIWCCIENILLAAVAEGIYGVTRIPGEDERKILKEQLNLPEGFEIPCELALGYPIANAYRARQVEIDLASRLHTGTW